MVELFHTESFFFFLSYRKWEFFVCTVVMAKLGCHKLIENPPVQCWADSSGVMEAEKSVVPWLLMLLWSWLGLLSIGSIIGLAPVYEIGMNGFWRLRNN